MPFLGKKRFLSKVVLIISIIMLIELNTVLSVRPNRAIRRNTFDPYAIKEEQKALYEYFGSNNELLPVVETLDNNDYKDDAETSRLDIMKLVRAVHQKFNWSPSDVQNYIRSTKIALSDTYKKIGDLQSFVEKNLIAPNAANDVLIFQGLSRDNKNDFSTEILKEIFNFKKYLEDNWKMKPNDIIEYIKQMKTETDDLDTYMVIIMEDRLFKQDVDRIKEISKKLKCDFLYGFEAVLKLKEISENDYDKILINYYDKTRDKYSLGYLTEITKYYKMQQPKIDDETLKNLVNDGAKNTELKPKLLMIIYNMATKNKLSPDSLLYYFRKNMKIPFIRIKYILILIDYGLTNNYPKEEIENIINKAKNDIKFIFKNCKKRNWSRDQVSRYIYESFKNNQDEDEMLKYLSASDFNREIIDAVDEFGGPDFWLGLKHIGMNYKDALGLKNKGYNALPLLMGYVNILRTGSCMKTISLKELELIVKYGDRKYIEKPTIITNTNRRIEVEYMPERDYGFILEEICKNTSIDTNTTEDILNCAHQLKPDAEALAKFIKATTNDSWKSNVSKFEGEYCKYPKRIFKLLEGIQNNKKLSENKKEKSTSDVMSDLKNIDNIFAISEEKKNNWPIEKTVDYIIESLVYDIPLDRAKIFLEMNSRIKPKIVSKVLKLKDKDYWKSLYDHGFSDFDIVLALKEDHSRAFQFLEIYKTSACHNLPGDKLISIINCDYPAGKFNDSELKDLFTNTCSSWSSQEVDSECDVAIELGESSISKKALIDAFKQGKGRKLGKTHWTLQYAIEFMNYAIQKYRPKRGWENKVYALPIDEMRYLIYCSDHNEKNDLFDFIYNSLKKGISTEDMQKLVELTKYNDVKLARALIPLKPLKNIIAIKNENCDIEEIANIIYSGHTKLIEIIKQMKKESQLKIICSRLKLLGEILNYDKKKNNSHQIEDFKTYIETTMNVEEELLIEFFKMAREMVIPPIDFIDLFKKKLGNYLELLQKNKNFIEYFHKKKSTGHINNLFKITLLNDIKLDQINNLFQYGGKTFTNIIEADNNLLLKFYNLTKDLNQEFITDILQITSENRTDTSDVVNFFENLKYGLHDIMQKSIHPKFKTYLETLPKPSFQTLEKLSSIIGNEKIDLKTLDIIFNNDGTKFFDSLINNEFWDLNKMIIFIANKLNHEDDLTQQLLGSTEEDINDLLNVCKKWSVEDFEKYLYSSLKKKIIVNDIRNYATLVENYQEALIIQDIGPYEFWRDVLRKSDLTVDFIINLYKNENRKEIKDILQEYNKSCNKITKQTALELLKYIENNNKNNNCIKEDIPQFLTIICNPDKFIGTTNDKNLFDNKKEFPENSCMEIKGISAYRNALENIDDLSEYAKRWIEMFNEKRNWNFKQIMKILKVSANYKIKPHVVNNFFNFFTIENINDIQLENGEKKFLSVMNLLQYYSVEDTLDFIKIIKSTHKLLGQISDENKFEEFLKELNKRKYPYKYMKSIVMRYAENSEYITQEQLTQIFKLKRDFKIQEILHCIEESKNKWWKNLIKKNSLHPCEVVVMIEDENSLITLDVVTEYANEDQCKEIETDLLKKLIKYYIKTSSDVESDFKYICDTNKWDKRIVKDVITKALELEDVSSKTVPFIIKTFTTNDMKDIDKTVQITSAVFNENKDFPLNEVAKFIKNYIKCNFEKDNLNIISEYKPKSKSRRERKNELLKRFLTINNELDKIAKDNCSWEKLKSIVDNY